MSRCVDFVNKRLHLQPSHDAYYEKALDALNFMDGSVKQLSAQPQSFLTKEISNGIQALADQVSLLKLGETIYEDAPDKFKSRIADREITTKRQALLRSSKRFLPQGEDLTNRIIKNLDQVGIDCENTKCSQREIENKKGNGVGWTGAGLRASLMWAQNELEGLHMELDPLVTASKEQTKEYMDYIGTTDRYINYRNNLNPSSCRQESCRANRLSDRELEHSGRPRTAGRWDFSVNHDRAAAVGTINYKGELGKTKNQVWNSTNYLNTTVEDAIQAAGIVTKYPGRTQMKDSYCHPATHGNPYKSTFIPHTYRHKSEQPKNIRGRASDEIVESRLSYSRGYKVNPFPDYINKNMGFVRERGYDDWYTPKSTYQHSYIYPDGKKIPRIFSDTPLD